jgi:hypothetical protein
MNPTGTRDTLLHPLAVALLLTSLALAAACQWLPPLIAWSWLAGWLVVWGAAGFIVTTLALTWAARLADPVELRELHAIRQALARRLAEQRSQERDGAARTWTSILSEAVDRVDDDVEPALRELLVRHDSVSRHLRLYERGRLPLPDEEILQRLRGIESRQRTAIQESVRQASNAEAALLALLQERQDDDVVGRARDWTDELLLLHDTLVRALTGDTAPEPPLVQVVETNWSSSTADDVPISEYVAASRSIATSVATVARHVEEALRSLSNLGALASCELIADLPHTLAAARDGVGGAEPTPPRASPGSSRGAARRDRPPQACGVHEPGRRRGTLGTSDPG